MTGPVNRRSYDSSRRRQTAYQRRLDILDAARRIFTEKGYAASTMADIATEAGVNIDTVYAGLGTKAELFALLIETALSGTADAIPADQRNYIATIRAEPEARRKLDVYAGAVTAIWGRMASLLNVLQKGAASDPSLAEIWDDFLLRRAENVRLLIDDLEAAGVLRSGLEPAEATDAAWAISSTEVYVLLIEVRGWLPERYREWLAESFKRLLLETAPGTA
jgi:AcrR family transcriptional regulator